MVEFDTSVLEEIGLTNIEIKVYLTLLEIGETKSGYIIKNSNVGNSGVYRALESLIKKGLVSYIIKNNVKYFHALDPDNLIKYIDNKKQKILELVPNLSKKNLEFENNAKIYVGYKAILKSYDDCLNELNRGEESLFFSVGDEDLSDKQVLTFFKNASVRRNELGIKMRGIAQKSTKKLFEKYPVKMNMRYIDLKLPTGVAIYKYSIIMTSWKENPISIVVTCKDIADSYRTFFEDVWKIAKS
jgi:sugar-specific transcriptional regulator TrmB